QIADVLRGKRKPTYTPHIDVGDFVIVVNAEKVAVTGNKRESKRYWRHSGYPGGIRFRTLGALLEQRPEEVIRRAVKGQVPRPPPGPPAAPQAQGLRRPGAPASGATARGSRDTDLMQDEEQQNEEQQPEEALAEDAATEAETPEEIEPPAAAGDQGDPGDQGGGEDGPSDLTAGEDDSEAETSAEREPPGAEAGQRGSGDARGDAEDGSSKKREDVVPGAELDPIAIEPERELDAEERARREAEEEERLRRERELIGDGDEEAAPVAAKPAQLSADATYAATGKRKSSVARVILRPGSGSIEVNKRRLDEYFPRSYLQSVAKQPLTQTGYEGSVDVRVRVHGGGISGQAAAVRHGIARALTEVDPALRSELKRRGMLTRDARVKERRKAGLEKARKKPQFSKR